MIRYQSAVFTCRFIRLGTTLVLALLLAGRATVSSESGYLSSARVEQNKSNHPWLNSVIGSPNVSEQQFDELPWWQQMTACISAMFARGVYDAGVHNSERELSR